MRVGVSFGRHGRATRRALWSGLLAVALVGAVACDDARDRADARSACSARPAEDPRLQAQQALLVRVIGCGAANQIVLALQPDPPRPSGWFRIERAARAGRAARVVGSHASATLAGANWYLDHVAGISVTWSGSRIELPDRLPAPDHAVERTSSVPLRIALNDTSSAYTAPFRTWPEWERLLDVLALHGVNAVNVTDGQEATYLATFTELGVPEDEVLRWLPLPAHLPWFLMGNLHGTGTPPSRDLVEQRASLGRQIVNRATELGIEPILPGYGGLVPPRVAEHLPEAHVVPQGTWNGYERPDWLDPTSPAFATVADTYYRAQARLFGTTGLSRIDLLHEGGRAGGVDLGAAAGAVADALHRHRPDAVWVTLGWQGNPRPEVRAALGPGDLLVLDGSSDTAFAPDRARDWPGTAYAFGSVLGFGGRTALGGNLAAWPGRLLDAASGAPGALRGVAYLPEAATGNPAAFDLFFELPWTGGRVELQTWFGQWAEARYGTSAAAPIGRLLLQSVYSGPSAGMSQGADSLFTVRPALYIGETVSLAQPLHYDPATTTAALDLMLDLPQPVRRSDAYRADLADLTRQVLADDSRRQLGKVASATRRRDVAELRELRDRWIGSMRLAGEVAATRSDHLLATWDADLRTWGRDDDERAAMAADARTLLTTWGARATADGGLSDYAGREWAGLIETHYVPRWSTWFDDLIAAVADKRPPPTRDWYAFDEGWAAQTGSGPSAPSGDIVDIARRVRATVGRR